MPAPTLQPESALRLLWAILWIGTAGCSDTTAPVPQSPISSASVAVDADSGSIFRTLTITLSDSGPVQVNYWTRGAPRLQVTDTSATTVHALFLPGLRADAVYEYEVRVPRPGQLAPPIFHGQLTTGPLPDDLAAIQFTVSGVPAHRLTMVELGGTPFSGYVILDRDGKVVWFRRGIAQSFARRANGNLVLLQAPTALTEIRPDLTVAARLPAQEGMRMHHDVIATPSNTLLFLSSDNFEFDGTTWVGDAVWEWSPEDGTAVKRWAARDFLSPATDIGPKSVPTDWLHANSLNLGPRRNVVVSFPALNQIVSIAPDFQRLEWRLGGPNATIVPVAGADFWFEHTAQEIAPNRVLLFDNGRDRPEGLFSRGLELELDPAAGSATIAWSFRPTPDIYAPIIGSARRLPNGITVVNFGTRSGILGATGPISTYDVRADGQVTWSLQITGGEILNYRSTPLEAIAGERVAVPERRLPRLVAATP